MVRASIEGSFEPVRLRNYEVGQVAAHSSWEKTMSSLAEANLQSSHRRSSTSSSRKRHPRRFKTWDTKWGSFGYTDVRRTQGFGEYAAPARCVVSWDPHTGTKTEVPIWGKAQQGIPTRSTAQQYPTLSRDALGSAVAHKPAKRSMMISAEDAAASRPGTADSSASALVSDRSQCGKSGLLS